MTGEHGGRLTVTAVTPAVRTTALTCGVTRKFTYLERQENVLLLVVVRDAVRESLSES
jgi:anti-anti-sigma regulatory factor